MSEATNEPESLDLHGAAALLGSYCAVERRLFELTGFLASEPDADPEVQVFLDSVSAEHAWHAELWADRLPVVSGIDAPSLVALPGPVALLLDEIAAGSQVARVAGLFRVALPRLVTSYLRHRAWASPASEGPTLRALRLVLRDETEAWAHGEAHLERLLGTPAAVEEAGLAVGGLESRLVAGGIGPGLLPWPGRRA